MTDLAVLRLDAMVIVTSDDEGLPALAHVAALQPAGAEGAIEYLDPEPPSQLDFDFRDWIRAREEELARQDQTRKVGDGERALLVSVTGGRDRHDVETQIDELVEILGASIRATADDLVREGLWR